MNAKLHDDGSTVTSGRAAMAGATPERAAMAGATPARTAFVAGATGYTGRAVVAELRSRGIGTVAHVRPDSPQLARWRDEFAALGATVDVSPWDEDALAAALARCRPDAVFSLLGTTRKRGRAARAAGAREDYETVDYGLSALLLRVTQRAAPSARFVYLSSLGVGPRARGGYLGARWRVEQELQASGLEWTIVRPAFVTGPDREERRPAERAASVAIDSLLSLARRIGARRVHDRFHSLTAAELARALVRHAFDPSSAGRVLLPESLR
jgi:uncharacterized protein YbjT (DUF2867 family)